MRCLECKAENPDRATIGDNLRMDYTALGHTASLAARMEQIAETGKAYPVTSGRSRQRGRTDDESNTLGRTPVA